MFIESLSSAPPIYAKLRNFALCLTIGTLSCKGSQSEESPQEQLELQDADLPQGDNSLLLTEELSDPIHPDEATAHSTRSLLLTTRQPSDASLNHCLTNLSSTSEKVRNMRDLEAASQQLRPLIKDSFDLYHWCFYQYMDQLDSKLARSTDLHRVGGPEFITGMKRLLLLAISLDKEDGNDIYRTYLKIRYQQVNHDFFGESLRDIYGQSKAPKKAAAQP
jgi:hypothetical protein